MTHICTIPAFRTAVKIKKEAFSASFFILRRLQRSILIPRADIFQEKKMARLDHIPMSKTVKSAEYDVLMSVQLHHPYEICSFFISSVKFHFRVSGDYKQRGRVSPDMEQWGKRVDCRSQLRNILLSPLVEIGD